MGEIDWGAYLDGSVTDAERARIETLLASSEAARADFEGFKEFRAALRNAALADPVPIERLEALLAKAAGRKSRSVFAPRVAFALAAAAAILALIGWRTWFYDPMLPLVMRVGASLETSDPVSAAQWVSQRTGWHVPVVTLAGMGQFIGVELGDDWFCYDFDVRGRRVHLFMHSDKERFNGLKATEVANHRLFLGDGVGWTCCHLAYVLKGADRSLLIECALRMEAELDRQHLPTSWRRRATPALIAFSQAKDRLSTRRLPCTCGGTLAAQLHEAP